MSWGSAFTSAWAGAKREAQDAAAQLAVGAKKVSNAALAAKQQAAQALVKAQASAREFAAQAAAVASSAAAAASAKAKAVGQQVGAKASAAGQAVVSGGKVAAASVQKAAGQAKQAVIVTGSKVVSTGQTLNKEFRGTPAGSPAATCPNVKKDTPPPPGANLKRYPPPTPRSPNAPPCELLNAELTCSHGRTAGKEGVLEVVPGTSLGTDSISGQMTMRGGCGTHPAWSVGGYWTSSGRGASFSLGARAAQTSHFSVRDLRDVSPHVYNVRTTACGGGPQEWEIRSYPSGSVSTIYDPLSFAQGLLGFLKTMKLDPPEMRKEEKTFKIAFEGKWDEDKDWRVVFKQAIKLAFAWTDSLKFPAYALTPPRIDKYIRAGLYITLRVGAHLDAEAEMWWWPSDGQTAWPQKAVTGYLSGKVIPSLELQLVHPDVLSAAISGEMGINLTALKFETKGNGSISAGIYWTGLKASISLALMWGWVEYSRDYILIEGGKEPWEYSFDG